jgi:hypothetical protein
VVAHEADFLLWAAGTMYHAGRLLVKLCIEVCCCLCRTSRIRLNQFLCVIRLHVAGVVNGRVLVQMPTAAAISQEGVMLLIRAYMQHNGGKHSCCAVGIYV